MVVDTTVISSVVFDYYLYRHAGLLGTSKPAHYNALLDENRFTLFHHLHNSTLGVPVAGACARYRATDLTASSPSPFPSVTSTPIACAPSPSQLLDTVIILPL